MIQIQIKKENGDIYWVDHFNKIKDAQDWLEIEKTRIYWDEKFTVTITDLDPVDEVSEAIIKEKRDKKQKEREDRVISLKAIDWSLINNFNDAKPILKELVKEFLREEN